MAGPLARVNQLLKLLWGLLWAAWNFLVGLNENDWLAVTSNENRRREQLFNSSLQSESLSLPWTIEMTQLNDEDAVELTCAYNLSPSSGLSDIQIDRIGVMRSVGVTEFYTGCLERWSDFLRQSQERLEPLDWSESTGSSVVARLTDATAGQSFSPQAYPLVTFAFGSYAWRGRTDSGNFRCCLVAVIHLRMSPDQPPGQIMRRFFLNWASEQEPPGVQWRPRIIELKSYYSTADAASEVGLCVVCQSEPACVLLLPCRHACVCGECAARLPSDLCPLCRRLAHSRLVLPPQPGSSTTGSADTAA